MNADDEDVRTDAQKEWAEWARSGYRKRFQPTSIRRISFVVSLVLVVGLGTVFWLAAHGRLG